MIGALWILYKTYFRPAGDVEPTQLRRLRIIVTWSFLLLLFTNTLNAGWFQHRANAWWQSLHGPLPHQEPFHRVNQALPPTRMYWVPASEGNRREAIAATTACPSSPGPPRRRDSSKVDPATLRDIQYFWAQHDISHPQHQPASAPPPLDPFDSDLLSGAWDLYYSARESQRQRDRVEWSTRLVEIDMPAGAGGLSFRSHRVWTRYRELWVALGEERRWHLADQFWRTFPWDADEEWQLEYLGYMEDYCGL